MNKQKIDYEYKKNKIFVLKNADLRIFFFLNVASFHKIYIRYIDL